jgi:uncharacterized protein DUF5661
MKAQREITLDEARLIGESLYLDWNEIDVEQFRRGLMGRKLHRSVDPGQRSTYRGVVQAGRTVMAHMQRFPDYFVRLARLRAEARAARSGGLERPVGPAG